MAYQRAIQNIADIRRNRTFLYNLDNLYNARGFVARICDTEASSRWITPNHFLNPGSIQNQRQYNDRLQQVKDLIASAPTVFGYACLRELQDCRRNLYEFICRYPQHCKNERWLLSYYVDCCRCLEEKLENFNQQVASYIDNIKTKPYYERIMSLYDLSNRTNVAQKEIAHLKQQQTHWYEKHFKPYFEMWLSNSWLGWFKYQYFRIKQFFCGGASIEHLIKSAGININELGKKILRKQGELDLIQTQVDRCRHFVEDWKTCERNALEKISILDLRQYCNELAETIQSKNHARLHNKQLTDAQLKGLQEYKGLVDEVLYKKQNEQQHFFQECENNKAEIQPNVFSKLEELKDVCCDEQCYQNKYDRNQARIIAIDQTKAENGVFSTYEAQLSPELIDYIKRNSIPIEQIEKCTGNVFQHQLHKETIEILEMARELGLKIKTLDGVLFIDANQHGYNKLFLRFADRHPLKHITNNVFEGVITSTECNKAGHVDKAMTINDICYSLLEYGNAIAEGVGEGGARVICHPIDTLTNIANGIADLGCLIGKAFWEIGKVEYYVATGRDDLAVAEIEQIGHNISTVIKAINEQRKQMTGPQQAKAVAAFLTESYVTGRYLSFLGKIFAGAKNSITKIVNESAKTGKKATELIATTAEGFEVQVAAEALDTAEKMSKVEKQTQKIIRGINDTGQIVQVSEKVKKTTESIINWIGEKGRLIKNKHSDIVLLSRDGTRRVRFDIKHTHPHNNPHGHVEELVNGVWARSGRIYPCDIPHN